jgi:flagellar hook-associated protein 2
MSGVSGSSTNSTVYGTNVPPISFPGISSGIDYNSIIQKLTSMTTAPLTQLNQQIATLNAANAELITINGLLASVQNALGGLSEPDLYNAVTATSSNTSVATASGIAGGNASAGTYVITATQLATATQVTGSAAVGHSELDALGASTGDQVPLVNSYAAITPSNGGGTQGSITINGVTVNYDVNTQSIQTIFANINTAVRTATGDASFNIGFAGGTDTVQITDANNPVSLGSQADQGNLLQVLRLDQAQIDNTGTSGSVTGTAGVGGINQGLAFNSSNASGTTDAGYQSAVTSGYFTINGVQIAVDATNDNLHSVLARINASAAGVNASYNAATGQITLTNKTTGVQSIVLGSSSDTSNFLSASGLTAASGAATTLGKQAAVTFQDASGAAHTVYSNSNTVTNAISGVQINLLSNSNSQFQITVGQDTSGLVTAVNTFVSAYNAAITEINTATAPPVVAQSTSGSSIGVPPSQPVGAGVLYGNSDVGTIKDELVNMVTQFLPNNTGLTSLSSIGLNLTSSFAQLTTSAPSGSSTTPQFTTQTMAGTDGQLQPLDASALQAAMASNPSSVQNLLNGAQGLVTQLGTYLTGVTGLPTLISNAVLGSIPTVSLIQGFENSNNSIMDSIQQQITQIQNNANQQADALRAEFVSTESTLAGYQAMQQQLSSFFTTSSSGG